MTTTKYKYVFYLSTFIVIINKEFSLGYRENSVFYHALLILAKKMKYDTNPNKILRGICELEDFTGHVNLDREVVGDGIPKWLKKTKKDGFVSPNRKNDLSKLMSIINNYFRIELKMGCPIEIIGSYQYRLSTTPKNITII